MGASAPSADDAASADNSVRLGNGGKNGCKDNRKKQSLFHAENSGVAQIRRATLRARPCQVDNGVEPHLIMAPSAFFLCSKLKSRGVGLGATAPKYYCAPHNKWCNAATEMKSL